MPKMKTHKGIKKRVRVTATGKIKHKRAGSGHLMSGKSGDRCRNLRQRDIMKPALAKAMKWALSGCKA